MIDGIEIFNELSEHITLKINACKKEYHDSNWVEAKAHKDYDLWYIFDGSVKITVCGSTFTANQGDVVFFYPDMFYTASMGVNGCRFLFTHFDFGIGNNLKILDDFRLAGIISAEGIEHDIQLFLNCYEAQAQKSDMAAMRLKGSFTILLASIIKLCSTKHERNFLLENSKNRNSGRLVLLHQVFKYISENIHKPIRIADIAKLSGMSEKYFITFFKKALGVSPGFYINQIKMNRAREYVLQQKHSIKEIAHLLGFPDQYSFSKAFRKYYNVPPSKFI